MATDVRQPEAADGRQTAPQFGLKKLIVAVLAAAVLAAACRLSVALAGMLFIDAFVGLYVVALFRRGAMADAVINLGGVAFLLAATAIVWRHVGH